MKVIGHRGAAGLALENTLPSFELARLIGVDAIEIDVRRTKDNKLAVIHDAGLDRVSDRSGQVRKHTLAELQRIKLNDNNSFIPSLSQVLHITEKTPVIIEMKDPGCVDILLEVIDAFPNIEITVVSFRTEELALLRQKRPKLRLFINELTKPFEIIDTAKRLHLNGIGLNFWLLNPLTYWLIRRKELDIFVFTVNSRVLGAFIGLLYPRVAICSDHPEWFVKHPYPIPKSSAHSMRKASKNGK